MGKIIILKQGSCKEFKESTIYKGMDKFKEMSKDCGVSSS